MSFLLDANALIALGWPLHEHHERMLKWFERRASAGWAATAFTQAAFVRVRLQPNFSPRPLAVTDVAGLLLRNTAHPNHRLLTMSFGFEEVLGCLHRWSARPSTNHRRVFVDDRQGPFGQASDFRHRYRAVAGNYG